MNLATDKKVCDKLKTLRSISVWLNLTTPPIDMKVKWAIKTQGLPNRGMHTEQGQKMHFFRFLISINNSTVICQLTDPKLLSYLDALRSISSREKMESSLRHHQQFKKFPNRSFIIMKVSILFKSRKLPTLDTLNKFSFQKRTKLKVFRNHMKVAKKIAQLSQMLGRTTILQQFVHHIPKTFKTEQ